MGRQGEAGQGEAGQRCSGICWRLQWRLVEICECGHTEDEAGACLIGVMYLFL